MSPRTQQQLESLRNERRQLILDAALHVFAEDSYHGSSVGQIAKRAKVSKGLIYNYFESKEDLVVQLMLDIFSAMEKEFAIDANTPIGREAMLRFIDKSFEVVLRDPQGWKLYFAIIMQPDVMALVMEKMLDRAQPYFRLMMEYFTAQGVSDPAAHARYFSATMDGIQFHLLLDPENFPVDYAKQSLIDQFIK